jgi:hypothetical protein
MEWIVVAAALAAGAGPAAAQNQEPQSAPRPIEEWIADLDSDRYEVREMATRHLMEHGRDAIDELAATADGERAEASARAIAVLEELSNTDEIELKLAVLERLSALQRRNEVSRRAQQRLSSVWAEISLPIAIEMGGRLDPADQFVDEVSGQHRSGKFILGRNWSGGDEGLAHVARLDFVHTLSLRHTPVSAAGLAQLSEMSSLVLLELYGVELAADELEALRKALPHVRFDVRSGAMLGVHGNVTAPSAQVAQVMPGSAADKAGMAPGDIIVKINDQEVASFTELTAEIAKRRPDESAVLTILRDDKEIQRKVTFGYWE